MPLDNTGQDQPQPSQAYVVGAAQGQVKRPSYSSNMSMNVVVSRMDEKRNAELLDAIVERLKPWMIDSAVFSDRRREY